MYGYSLGSIVGCEMAAAYGDRIIALILEAPIGGVETIVKDGAYLNLPASYVTSYEGDNSSKVKNVYVPLLWLHGTQDESLDREKHGLPIWNSYGGSRGCFVKVEGSAHSGIPSGIGYACSADRRLYTRRRYFPVWRRMQKATEKFDKMTRALYVSIAALALNGAAETDSAQTLPVHAMSFNIRYGTAPDGMNRWSRRRHLVFETITRRLPDVIGLQEALRFQIDQICDSVPGYRAVGVGREDGKDEGEHAAILYRSDRFRVDTSGTFWLSDKPGVPGSRHWGNRQARICTWARLTDRESGRGLYVYNTHLDHWSVRSRRRSVQLIARKIEQCRDDEPVILTGDFNAGQNSPIVRYLTANKPLKAGGALPPVCLTDTWRAADADETHCGTYNWFRGVRGGRKIDFILTSDNVRVAETEIVRDHWNGRYPSDHFPVTARLLF